MGLLGKVARSFIRGAKHLNRSTSKVDKAVLGGAVVLGGALGKAGLLTPRKQGRKPLVMPRQSLVLPPPKYVPRPKAAESFENQHAYSQIWRDAQPGLATKRARQSLVHVSEGRSALPPIDWEAKAPVHAFVDAARMNLEGSSDEKRWLARIAASIPVAEGVVGNHPDQFKGKTEGSRRAHEVAKSPWKGLFAILEPVPGGMAHLIEKYPGSASDAKQRGYPAGDDLKTYFRGTSGQVMATVSNNYARYLKAGGKPGVWSAPNAGNMGSLRGTGFIDFLHQKYAPASGGKDNINWGKNVRQSFAALKKMNEDRRRGGKPK